MAWAIRLLVLVGLASVWFGSPFGGQQQQDTASIRTYDSKMELSADGRLRSVETITVEMPAGKRGIFRIFDTADPRRSNVDHPVRVDSVERDGVIEPYVHIDGARGTDTIRIGNEYVYLDAGEHVYRIVSSTEDVLEAGRAGETLWWWDVVGSGWQMSIGEATVRAELPAEPLRAECVSGKDDPCTATVEGTTLSVRTGPLAPYTPVTVRVAFAADDVAEPMAPARHRDLLWAIAAAVLAAGVAAWGWRATREREPGFPVLFEPPFMVPPAVGVKVLDERHSDDDLQATLFDLAERGVLRLRGDDAAWQIEVVEPLEGEHLHPTERALLTALGLTEAGEVFVVAATEGSGRVVSSARGALRSQVDASASTFLHRSGPGVLMRLLGWVCLGATLFMVGRYFVDAGWLRWPLLAATSVFTLAAAGMMVESGLATVRTPEGRDLWSRAGGFARFLTTDSSEARFDAAAHLDWYPRYLSWATALGVADAWASRYEAQGVAVPDVPWVVWAGSGQFHAGSMRQSFDGAISSATTAYAAAQAASSSSGGGGFSGGSGGGGGGGGSW